MPGSSRAGLRVLTPPTSGGPTRTIPAQLTAYNLRQCRFYSAHADAATCRGCQASETGMLRARWLFLRACFTSSPQRGIQERYDGRPRGVDGRFSWPVAHCAQNARYATFANDPRNVFLHYYGHRVDVHPTP